MRRRLTPFFPTIADSPQWVLQNMPEYVEGALWRLRRGVIPRLITSRTAVHSLRAFALFCIKKSGQRLRPRRLLPPALAVPGHFPHIESVPRSLSWTNQRPVLLPQRSAQYPLYFQMHSEKRAAPRPLQSRQKEDLFSALCLPASPRCVRFPENAAFLSPDAFAQTGRSLGFQSPARFTGRRNTVFSFSGAQRRGSLR